MMIQYLCEDIYYFTIFKYKKLVILLTTFKSFAFRSMTAQRSLLCMDSSISVSILCSFFAQDYLTEKPISLTTFCIVATPSLIPICSSNLKTNWTAIVLFQAIVYMYFFISNLIVVPPPNLISFHFNVK